MLINILAIFKDFYFMPYLFGGLSFLGLMNCLSLILFGR